MYVSSQKRDLVEETELNSRMELPFLEESRVSQNIHQRDFITILGYIDIANTN
jgi:hypothetical protein